MKSMAPRIRALLRHRPDGATAVEVADALSIRLKGSAHRSMMSMPDVYVDRWLKEKSTRGQYAAVFMLADVPADTPRPAPYN